MALAVARPPPVPSSKHRNRAAHIAEGNTTPVRGRTPEKRRLNSLSNLVQFKKPRAAESKPTRHAPTDFSKFRKCRKRQLSTSTDSDWKQQPPRTSTAPKATTFNQISHAALVQLQQDANLSDHQLRAVLRFHRKETGRPDLYEPYFEKFLTSTHKVFSDHFTSTEYLPHPPLTPTPMVLCTQTEQLLRKLETLHHRKIRAVHHGVDSGKDFLKFDFTLEFEPDTPSSSATPDHGRRRVIIIAILPHIAESIAVFRHVYDLLQLPTDHFFFSFHSDFKAISIATGVAGASASYPCPFCERRILVSTPLKSHLAAGTIRSCASNRRRFKAMKRSTKQDPAQHASCVADPLQVFPQNSPIISWCRLPPLHLHLFHNWFINHIVRLHPPAADWYHHFHQIRSDYHGGDFQGPQLYRLTRPDSLEYLHRLLSEAAADSAILFFDTMTAFVDVQHRCFGMELLPFRKELTLLRNCILRLPIHKLPLKLHVMSAHLQARFVT